MGHKPIICVTGSIQITEVLWYKSRDGIRVCNKKYLFAYNAFYFVFYVIKYYNIVWVSIVKLYMLLLSD